jgi:lambda family phage portal protein
MNPLRWLFPGRTGDASPRSEATPGDIGLTPDGRPLYSLEAPKTSARMYASARSKTVGNWTLQTASADSEIHSSLTQLRARSRQLVRDSAYAKRARAVVVNNVIGAGMGLQAKVNNSRKLMHSAANDGIEAAFEKWSRAEFCHTGGVLNFADIEQVSMGEVFEAGEIFVRMHFSKFGGSDVPFALEVIESERVPHDTQPLETGANRTRMGVELDEFFRPLAYWIRDRHPGDNFYPTPAQTNVVRRIPAEEIIHLRVVDRWPQTRGVPWMNATTRKLSDMDGYTEAEITAARAAANYLGWEENPDLFDPDVERQADGTYETTLTPGTILRPRPGSKLNFYSPNRPNSALDPFMRHMLREFAAGTGVSYETISRDYSQSNYSSSRLAMLDDRDLWKVIQQWFIRSFRERVHRAWLRQAVMARAVAGVSLEEYAVNPEKFEAMKCKPRGWSWIDPTKEVQAYKEAVRNGFTSNTAVVAMSADGRDIDDVLEERADELEKMAALGLVFDTDPAQVQDSKVTTPGTPPAGAAPPAEEGEDTGGGSDTSTKQRPMRVIK